MIQILICDDSKHDLEIIEQHIVHYGRKEHIDFDIRKFFNPEAVLYELQDGSIPQIFILDVEMPGMDGFELAEKIRKITSTSILLFLTSHEDLAIHGYKVNAFRYISKLKMESGIEEALCSSIKELQVLNKKCITLKHYSDIFLIPYKEIIYVMRLARVLKIKTVFNGELSDYRGINELYESLGDSRFLFIDRSCFVNIYYINSLSGYDLILKNGDTLPVSRRSLQKVKQALLEYWSL